MTCRKFDLHNADITMFTSKANDQSVTDTKNFKAIGGGELSVIKTTRAISMQYFLVKKKVADVDFIFCYYCN